MFGIEKRGFSILFSGMAILFLSAIWSRAEIYTFDTPARWRTWQIPHGIVQVTDEGHLELTKYRKNINAVSDAHLFSHPTQTRGAVSGGIWKAGTRSFMANRIIDGNLETFWQPDPGDDLVDWVVEIDLGRSVLAKEIRLTFPDREGARPFRQFSVFVATGARIQVADDVFKYNLVYRTTQPNTDAFIRIPVSGNRDTTRVVDPGLEIDLDAEKRHFAIQFIRIVVDGKSEDAALAEVEVIAAGDNVSLGVLERGGSFSNGLLAREPQNMFDGNMNTFANVFTVKTKGGWRESGVWWEGDLGALFWIDEMYLYFQTRGEAMSFFLSDGFNYGQGYQVLYSDGKRTISGKVDYTPLFEQPQASNSREGELRHFRYIFKARKIRYLFWHALTDQGWYSHPMEMLLFSPGYPAQVLLRSDFIDLGQLKGDGRPKAINALSWDADLPPDTRLQLRSRSGNSMEQIHSFSDKKGDKISEEKWNSLPKVIRGPIDTTVVVSEDWGEWSNFYQFPGERFQSDTPRRFVQLELILSTENPEVAPALRSLSIEFEDALVREAKGRVLPREVMPNEDTHFIYTLWPRSDVRDDGFDQLRFSLPGKVDGEGIVVHVGGKPVVSAGVAIESDSLLRIVLPEKVTDDSVQVEFTTRVLRNATVFSVDLGNTERPGLWQSVEASERRSNIVFLPELTDSNHLIGDLEIEPPLFTPNGDGINDEVEIRFVLFKVEGSQPRVRVYDLAGRMVAELDRFLSGGVESFSWSGRDVEGNLVYPGIYLCHIDAGADAGEDTVVRSIAVAY